MSRISDAPLAGVVVLDLTRMLPGAMAARQLLEMGARLIKIEDPASGDPLRHSPPLVDGVGAGFATMLAGAESMGLDLRQAQDAARVRRLAARADVVVESFRPGTMERWGLGYERLRAANPRLVYCAISSFGQSGPLAKDVGHDLNFAGLSGLLDLLGPPPGPGVAGVQVVDITGALMAVSAILAALLAASRTGNGRMIDQPLARAPLPFLTWGLANVATGERGVLENLLAGRCACYRVYECAGGGRLALGAIEPKFWASFVGLLGLGDLGGLGYDPGPEGRQAADRVSAVLAGQPREHWIELCQEAGLPVTPIDDLASAVAGGYFERAGLVEPGGQGKVGAPRR